jgi:hypothetical protein
MSAPFNRHYAAARSSNAGASGMRMALDCARGVYEAVDRRMPEAAALATWLRQNAETFGLPDTAIPDDDAPRRSRRRGVPMPEWRNIGSALTSAEAAIPDNADTPADRWIEAIAGTLALDPLEARILVLALHYKLDQRVERLFDAISECRGLITRFPRDSGLMAQVTQQGPRSRVRQILRYTSHPDLPTRRSRRSTRSSVRRGLHPAFFKSSRCSKVALLSSKGLYGGRPSLGCGS